MARKLVLDVGNCSPDHAAIKRLLIGSFDVEVDQAHGSLDTLQKLEDRSFDLVLINRKLDQDYSDGLEILKQLKAHERFSSIPVMLITNFEEHQQLAIAEGGVRGFGKLELQSTDTREKLASVLAEDIS